ncbi:MAG: hypothetical protein RIQ79_1516 [Verrucomicrobiota bacterium]|jgi:hypothetical protein
MALTRKVASGVDLAYGLDGSGGVVDKTSLGLAAAVTTTGDTSAPLNAITAIDTTGELSVNTTARDSQAVTVAHLIGAVKNTLKIDGYASAMAVPKLGDCVSHGGVGGLCVSSNISASNEDFVKASLNVQGGGAIVYTDA